MKSSAFLFDRPDNPTRFLILGSAAPNIVKNVSETLAGRVEFVELSGFDLGEVGRDEKDKLWLRGGFPRSFLAGSDDDSMAWRENFVQTFLERDVPQLGITIPSAAMRRFWTMLAHNHSGIWNASFFRALWLYPTKRFARISTFSRGLSWFGNFSPGSRMSASGR